jgi:FkbM family methyltransferase
MNLQTLWRDVARAAKRWLRGSAKIDPRDFEGVLERVYRGLLHPGDVAIDVGANVGRHTICMAQQVAAGGRVYAFEPIPFCRQAINDMLSQSCHAPLRGVVRLSDRALSAKPGTAEFTVAVDAPGYSGLKERHYDIPTRLEKIPVRVERLDDVFRDLSRCVFIKIDAEGGEYDALIGGKELLQRLRPVVGFEFGLCSCSSYSVTPALMAQLWMELGYTLLDIRGKELDREAFIASATAQQVWDYFAVPAEKREVVKKIQGLCQV